MLVLTRKIGESILVGDEIEITLVRIEGDQARIGISAPRHVQVYRKELLDEVQEENLRAARAAEAASRVNSEAKPKLGKLTPSIAPAIIKKSDKSKNRTDD